MRFYATFESDHLDGTGGNKYVVVEADGCVEACQILFVRFGDQWKSLYSSLLAAGVYERNLQCVNSYDTPLTKEAELE